MFISQNVQLITPDEEELQLDYAIDRNYFINDNSKPVSINVQEIFTSVKFLFQLNIMLLAIYYTGEWEHFIAYSSMHCWL